MKRFINNIARYIIGIWVMVLLLLLACVCNEDNIAADRLITFVFITFAAVTLIFFLTYFIHLFWMIREKRKPQNLKSDIIYTIVLVLALCAYDIYAGVFSWQDLCRKIVFVLVFIVFSNIGQYIYSWKE